MATRHGGIHAVDPFADNTLPNVSSGLGLGYRRMIKPELYFPGGREHVRMLSSGNGLTVRVNGAAKALRIEGRGARLNEVPRARPRPPIEGHTSVRIIRCCSSCIRPRRADRASTKC